MRPQLASVVAAPGAVPARAPSRLYTGAQLASRTALLCSGLYALADGDVEAARVTLGLHAAGAVDSSSTVPPGAAPRALHALAGRLLTPPRRSP